MLLLNIEPADDKGPRYIRADHYKKVSFGFRIMSNLSPSFNTRFASIGIATDADAARPPKKPAKKLYPASLYPENYHRETATTPSRAPVLSTAKRAVSRHSNPLKQINSSSTATKRHLNRPLAESADPETQSPCKSKPRKAPDLLQCSFMKETSSSRNRQALAEKQARQAERSLIQTRAASHSEIYNRRPGHLGTKKRLFPKSAKSTDLASLATKNANVPEHTSPRHVSTAYTNRDKEDVYARLYNNALKLKTRLDKSRNTSNRRPSSRSRSPNCPSIPLEATMFDGSRSMDSRKPWTVNDVYQIIFAADPLIFNETNSLDFSIPPVAGTDPRQLLDSTEGAALSIFERGELMRKSNVYYLPNLGSGRDESSINISSFKNNYGFDDLEGNYVIHQGDHIEYRYEILRILGTGSFGNVVLCADRKYQNHVDSRKVAIKIIKNELDWSLQAVSEIKLLKSLNTPPHASQYIMNYCDHFHFRGHMCIVSEVLSLNLYTFLELTSFSGVRLALLRKFARDILRGLSFIHDTHIIHCDIKPENIMIKLPPYYDPNQTSISDFLVKIIDFGSSCYENETSYSYIQSRFYRAPEVILGAQYGSEIDIWSFGCVIAELFSGTPLLPGKSELEQMGLILEMFGAPSCTHIINERKRLMRQVKIARSKGLSDPLVSDPSLLLSKGKPPVDERKIKKTLLYSLFNLEGKLNLKFLNTQLQSVSHKTSAPSPFKRTIKPNSKSIEVALRLHSSQEDRNDGSHFSKFLHSIFRFERETRATATELLGHVFLNE